MFGKKNHIKNSPNSISNFRLIGDQHSISISCKVISQGLIIRNSSDVLGIALSISERLTLISSIIIIVSLSSVDDIL